MMILDELPTIEGGTPKQRLFAEGVRLKYFTFIDEELDPEYYEGAELVLRVRVHYKWWIEQAKRIDEKSIRGMIRNAKASITRAGSVEAAVQKQRETIRKNLEKYQEYLKSRDMFYYDAGIEFDISLDAERERPF